MNQENRPVTLSLFADNDVTHAPKLVAENTSQWALSLDHREWLSLLAEEWWPIKSTPTAVPMGIGAPLSPLDPNEKIDIVAWVDPNLLPAINLKVRRAAKWITVVPQQLQPEDQQIAWPGPIPLFAVTRFCVESPARKDHLAAMAQGFANLGMPEQGITVEAFTPIPAYPSPQTEPVLQPPELWNAFRGAAAMAVWSAPSVAPWLEMLCQMLSKPSRPSRPRKLPDTATPWLQDTPWRFLGLGVSHKSTERSTLLWRAMLTVLAQVKIREAWRPHEVLELVCDHARQQGLEPTSLDSLLLETAAILDDRKVIDSARADSDPLGFVLQLILLRPKPEQFVSWRVDLPSLPPAVLWTGAILSGLINGYRNLEVRFRGSVTSRKVMDLKTWTLSTTKPPKWPDEPEQILDWQLKSNVAQLLSGSQVWAERKLGRRGTWYHANLDDPALLAQAVEIAREEFPEALTRYVRIADSRTTLQGTGNLSVNGPKRQLIVKGELFLTLPPNAPIAERLDHERFKHWIATAALKRKLPPPVIPRDAEPISSAPAGLKIITDYITADLERELIATVNSASWSSELKRRVQHYGWKYDYKSRDIQSSAYIGPLPAWAQDLANRLLNDGLMPELADQVIVNEYVLDQGISKHIDCLTCFRGPVITISLVESWQMVFRKGKDKVELILPRCSAAVIDDSARYEWTHEIPQRKYEGNQPRTRRISLTFRKVNLPAQNTDH